MIVLANGASLVWPRGGRPRTAKSREVDLCPAPYEIRRRTFLKVYDSVCVCVCVCVCVVFVVIFFNWTIYKTVISERFLDAP